MGQSPSAGCCLESDKKVRGISELQEREIKQLECPGLDQDYEQPITPNASNIGLAGVRIHQDSSNGSADCIGEVSADLTQFGGDLLRGIPLRKTLRGGGKLWRYKPTDLNIADREKLYSYSRPTQHLDMFISHTWSTPGRWKYLSLLLRFGWRSMLIAWAIGTFTTALLCLLDIIPLPYEVEVVVLGQASPMAVGGWLTIAGLVSSLGGLIASPYLPWSRSDMAFVDCTCVHQADEVLMQQGISNIGGFLATARELRVLWSAPYLSRLWCIFELAAYRKLNPTGKITFSALFIEIITFQIFLWLHVVTSLFWHARITNAGRMVPTGWLLFVQLVLGCLYLPLIHGLRRSYVSKQSLIAGLDSFDVRKVECLVDSDRHRIHSAIVNWYGSLDAFSAYVRGSFREDVVEPMNTPGSIPFGYICVLSTPLLNVALEGVLTLLKSGSSFHSIFAYALSTVISLPLLWVPAVLILTVFVCERGVTPGSGRWRDYLQTLAIVLAVWFIFTLGALCAISASQTSFELVLLWTVMSLLFSSCTWRYCWRWRRGSA